MLTKAPSMMILSLTDTLKKSNLLIERMKDRESVAKVPAEKLNPMARADRPIFECQNEEFENISSSSGDSDD